MSAALVGIAKNEETNIEEWIRFHSAVGFSKFVVYDNGSSDSTRSICSVLGRSLDVELIEWNKRGPRYQVSAYEDAADKFSHQADWMAFLDIDEFLVPKADGTIVALIERLSEFSAIALNWALFGSSGHVDVPAGLITQSYKYRAPAAFPPNHHTKMLLRPSALLRFVNAHFAEVKGDIVGTDGASKKWLNEGVTENVDGFELARINHYFIKSRADWKKKVLRGYSDDLQRSLDDFELYDHNEVFDDIAALVMDRALRNQRKMDDRSL